MTKAEQETYDACATAWQERAEQHRKQAALLHGLGLPVEARIAEAQAESVMQCLADLAGGE